MYLGHIIRERHKETRQVDRERWKKGQRDRERKRWKERDRDKEGERQRNCTENERDTIEKRKGKRKIGKISYHKNMPLSYKT